MEILKINGGLRNGCAVKYTWIDGYVQTPGRAALWAVFTNLKDNGDARNKT